MHSILRRRPPRIIGGILVVMVILGAVFLAMAGRLNPTRAASQTFSATNYPVIFIHGYSLTSSDNCGGDWNPSQTFLQSSQRSPQFTGPMVQLGYYTNDTSCGDNLSTSGSPWRSSCIGYDGTSEQDVGTNNESIRHLACELAWYIYDNYSQYDTNVQLVNYSMGGLIARYALYAVHNHLSPFPPSLYAHNVLDFDTPNGGVPGPGFINCHCIQALQLLTISSFMNELKTSAQNPQGSGWGTSWTMLASIPNQQMSGCDRVVSTSSALYMDGGHKVVYKTPCYPHTGKKDMLQDASTNLGATVYLCDNCPKTAALNNNWQNWTTSSTYPHSINEMYLSLFQVLPNTAIVSVPDSQGGDACLANPIAPNDDGSSSAITLPFTANFYGVTYSSLYVNENGNVSFDTPLSDYTPYPLNSTTHAIIAPYFADVDTRGSGPGLNATSYGSGTYQGHPTFCVDWLSDGYYNLNTDKLNSFQLLLVDRSDRKAGDFDIVMNYNQIQWETGDASGGSHGFGGTSARVGYTNGSSNFFELSGSGVSGALLDVNLGLISGSLNSNQLGSYIFAVQNTGASVPGKRSAPTPIHGPKPKPQK